MDVNGTRFQLLLGTSDWAACSIDDESSETLAERWQRVPDEGWDAATQELTLPAEIFRFPSAPSNRVPRIADRRGAARDRYGNWYWIDEDEREILVRSAGSGLTTVLWSAELAKPAAAEVEAGDFQPRLAQPVRPLHLRGLVVTAAHYLVVGVLEPRGLLVFDLHAGGAPRQLLWPTGFAPFDFAPAPSGGLWILERADGSVDGRLWLLDRHFNAIRLTSTGAPGQRTLQSDFAPAGGNISADRVLCTDDPPLDSSAALALGSLRIHDAVAIASLEPDSVLILDNGGDSLAPPASRIWAYQRDVGLSGPMSLASLRHLLGEDAPVLLAHDLAVIQTGDTTILYLVSQDGDQAFAFTLTAAPGGDLVAIARPEFWPMLLFGGRGLVATDQGVYYDSRSEWIPLAQQQRPTYQREWTILTPMRAQPGSAAERGAFDGRDHDCVWHRLLLDACIPPDAALEVSSRAANSERELRVAEWYPEPKPYPRTEGSELPWLATSARPGSATWEVLFQRERGRYLQLRITLRGNGRTTPRLRAVRAYYPRFSYLEQYLPAVYRDDEVSASFLDRFLGNLEGLHTAIEDRIANVQALFDARSVPAEYLDWLAGWFGVALDPHWEERRRRLFIAHAPRLFAERGTLPGLVRAIRLATDPCPDESIFTEAVGGDVPPRRDSRPPLIRIIEHFRTRRAPGVVFGDPMALEGPGVSAPLSEWTPSQGAAALHNRFREFLRTRYIIPPFGHASFDEIELPPTRPPDGALAADWEAFIRVPIGFTYAAVTTSDIPAYRQFLARRYGPIGALNTAYGLALANYSQLALPAAMPTGGAPLRDWIQFVSIVLPSLRAAHRFTVLVPSAASPQAERGSLVARVQQVVELEKPAHTMFTVREYWAALRVGDARVGLDTVLDGGSRLSPAVLDATTLAQSYLAPGHPWSVSDRTVLGRDAVATCRLPGRAAATGELRDA
jgi:phage tail-like protein